MAPSMPVATTVPGVGGADVAGVTAASYVRRMDINGTCDERFEAMRGAFANNFSEGQDPTDVAASVALTIDGEVVVDLWGGTVTTDSATDVPWERDTIVNVW